MKKYPIITSLLIVLFFNYSLQALPSVTETTFTQVTSPVTSDINSVTWVSNTICMAVTSDGQILRSEDAGLNWTATQSATTKSLNDIDFYDDLQGMIVGGESSLIANNSQAFGTTDGGLTWFDISTTYQYEALYSVAFSNKPVGGNIFKTEDGEANIFAGGMEAVMYLMGLAFLATGGNFDYFDLAVASLSGVHIFFLLFVAAVGLALGGDGKIAKTTDNGSSFNGKTSNTTDKLNSGGSSGTNNSSLYKSNTNELGQRSLLKTDGTTTIDEICAVGDNGTLIGSTDEGETWAPYTSGTTENINGMATFGIGELTQYWYVTDNGGIFMKDGLAGEPVQATLSTSNLAKTELDGANLKDIAISMNGIAIAVGEGGVIYRAVLEGIETAPLAPSGLSAVFSAGPPDVIEINWQDNSDNETGFYVWKNGPSDNDLVLIDSVDADVTAYNDSTVTESGIYSYLISAYNNMGETIAETECTVDVDLTDIVDETIPTDYMLYQNYPNPFNPTTVITFDIQEASSVKIEVYDMIGTRIKTLINGRVNSGKHEITFNAENLPSGIYFYRLTTPQHQSTRKMSLIK